jgi:hypothetical protein
MELDTSATNTMSTGSFSAPHVCVMPSVTLDREPSSRSMGSAYFVGFV